jgi:multiple sugar transport system substrate-binding protein
VRGKQTTSLIAVAMAALMVAGACSSAATTAPATAAPATAAPATAAPATAAPAAGWGNIDWQQFKGTTLNVLMTAMPVADIYKAVIPDFESLTGMKVNFSALNDGDRKKAQLVDFSGGTGQYDVSNVGLANREEFVAGNYLEPLQPYLDDAKLTDSGWYNIGDYATDIIAAGYAGADAAGKLVYIPFTGEYFLLWYRKDIFQKLGLTAPKTIDELKTVAQKLDDARKAGTITEYAFMDRAQAGASEAGWNMFCGANRMGLQMVDFVNKKNSLDTPQGIEFMTFYTDMIKKYGPPGSGNWTWPDISKAFSQGQLAMTVAGNASYATLEDAATSKVAGKVGYAPPPFANGGKDPLWEWGWSINAGSKNKKAAWLFLEWATSVPLMKQISPKFGVPARSSIYADPTYLAAMPNQEFVESQAWMLKNGTDPRAGFVMTADYGKVADLISKEMNAVLAGQQTPAQAAKAASEALSKAGYPPAT